MQNGPNMFERLSWDDLHLVAVAARSKTLAALARHLGQDATTVSRRMSRIEGTIGLALFERQRGALSLTIEGARLAGLLAEMEKVAQTFHRAADALGSTPVGPVVVSAPPSIARHLIAPHIQSLRQDHPGIEIVLNAEPQNTRVGKMEADVAVRLGPPPDDDPSLLVRRIGRLPYSVFAPRTDWSGDDWIAYPKAFSHTPEGAWVEDRLDSQPAALRTDDPVSMALAVLAGTGRALLAEPIGKLVPIVLEERAVLLRDVHLIRRATTGTSAVALVSQRIAESIAAALKATKDEEPSDVM